MQLGIIGLGRMGGNIARRLMLNGHATVVYDRNEAFVKGLSEEGATGVADLKALVAGLQKVFLADALGPFGLLQHRSRRTLERQQEQ